MGTTIIINGIECVVGGSVSYEQIVELAGAKGTPSIAYCAGEGWPHVAAMAGAQ